MKVFRPTLDDVERLSHGKGAKRQRGTGSRDVCHRLNRDERSLYERAKQTGFLTVRGTGYRKERKGSPICNTFRQRCDALEEICIIVEKRAEQDTVIIDFSTLRVLDDSQFVSLIVDNVFRVKYPELLLDIGIWKKGLADDASSVITRDSSNTSVSIPIYWDAVQTKPIWMVNKRLISVGCDRDVAKALAIDILKESANFDKIDMEEINTAHASLENSTII